MRIKRGYHILKMKQKINNFPELTMKQISWRNDFFFRSIRFLNYSDELNFKLQRK